MKTAYLAPDAGLPTHREELLAEADARLRERAECEILDEPDASAYVWEWVNDKEDVVDMIHAILGAYTADGKLKAVDALKDAWDVHSEARIIAKMREMGEQE